MSPSWAPLDCPAWELAFVDLPGLHSVVLDQVAGEMVAPLWAFRSQSSVCHLLTAF